MTATITEKAFMAQVVQLAKICGWRIFHPYDSRRSTAGWPDLVAIRRGVMVIAELKVGKNKTTLEQAAWLNDFRELATYCLRIKVFVWYPDKDWPEIEETLR